MTLTLLVNTIVKKKSWLSGITTKLKQANKQATNLTVCNRCNAMQCNATGNKMYFCCCAPQGRVALEIWAWPCGITPRRTQWTSHTATEWEPNGTCHRRSQKTMSMLGTLILTNAVMYTPLAWFYGRSPEDVRWMEYATSISFRIMIEYHAIPVLKT